jgi:hypothetical protein
MRKKRKKSYKEIACKTIDVDNLITDTTKKESYQMIQLLVSKRKYLIFLLLVSGIISVVLTLESFLGFQLFSIQLGFINIIAMTFVGFSNIFCGLLLLSSE